MPGPSIFQKISFLKNRRQFQRQKNVAITLTRIRGLSHVRIIGSRTAHEGRRGSDLTAVSAVRSGLKRSAAIGRPGIGRMGTIACNAGREKKKRTVKDRQSKQRSKNFKIRPITDSTQQSQQFLTCLLLLSGPYTAATLRSPFSDLDAFHEQKNFDSAASLDERHFAPSGQSSEITSISFLSFEGPLDVRSQCSRPHGRKLETTQGVGNGCFHQTVVS